MHVQPLSRVLTLQSLLAIVVPFGVVALFGFLWILPQIRKDAGEKQIQLALAVGMRVESHLETGAAIVRIAAAIPRNGRPSGREYQRLLDSLLGSTDAMSSLYVITPDGKVSDVALTKREQMHRDDLGGLNLSLNPLFREVSREKKPLWSETFLSMVTGGLVTAYGVSSAGATFVGEVDLALLTKFLKNISTGKDLIIIVVDKNGQVVADNNGRYTAQQLNIGNIPLVRTGIDTNVPTTGRFDFAGSSMTGSIIQIASVDWHVMVAKTDASLYRTSRHIALIVMAGMLVALACASMASIYLARRLALRFDALTRHARNFAHGDRSDSWPRSSVAEFNQLSDNLQFMADTLHQQEIVLRDNENRMGRLYSITQYPFTDESGFLDHALDEVLGLAGSPIGYICFYNEQKRQFSPNIWSRGVMKECAVREQKAVYDLDDTGLRGEAVRQRKAILLNDFSTGVPLKKGVPEGHVFLKRFLTVPVIVEGAIVAVVGVANKENDYLDSDVMQLTLFMDAVWKIVSGKRAETERNQMEQQMLHSQKLESLGVLAGGIAHDFNNILMTIIGNADLALMRINKESPAVDNLHRIEQAADRAADLARQMLAYYGKGKFVIEHIDLNVLLEEMLHMLEVSVSKKAVLRFNPYHPLPPVEADATQMRQIIMNLVINASEAIGDKSGAIAITTGCMDCDQNYLKNVWLDENLADGLYVYLEISDSGCGMDGETLTKLFDPFFTTKFTGRGLGMAAVLGIVRGHKGAIKVYSEPGRGTAFKILLPASDRPAGLFDGDSCTSGWKGSGTILLVDDEETIRGIGTEMLKELGFEVITAADGYEAVEAFTSTPSVSLVILDLTMPHMDGEQCFQELRRLDPDVKVIMSSGYNEQEVTQMFIGKGLAGFLQKPYKLSSLQEVIQAIRG
ncbi:MAG: response regulator [Desulfuromonadaceae bacterium]